MSNKVKLAIIGNQGVGKTTFIKMLQPGNFEEPMPTIAIDFLSIKDFKLDEGNEDQKYTLQVFDLAGLAKNTDLVINFIKQSEGVFLAFEFREDPKKAEDHKPPETGQNIPDQIEYWLKQVMERKPQPICLIATKADRIEGDQQELTKEYEKLILDVLGEIDRGQIGKSGIEQEDNDPNILVNSLIVKNEGKSFFVTSSKEQREYLKIPTRELLRRTIQGTQKASQNKSKSPSFYLNGPGKNHKSSERKNNCC